MLVVMTVMHNSHLKEGGQGYFIKMQGRVKTFLGKNTKIP